jgi:hypothetical protein
MKSSKLLLSLSLWFLSLVAFVGISYLISSGNATVLSISLLSILALAAKLGADELERLDDEGLL